ncbi:MAG TPA: hypothetical protein VK116_15950, partial [Planctomycetota bacterium]|nr:hypothetical protein [Planctomycetota bacterium]
MRNPFRWLLRRRVETSPAGCADFSPSGADEDTRAARERGGGLISAAVEAPDLAEVELEPGPAATARASLEVDPEIVLRERLEALEARVSDGERRVVERIDAAIAELGRSDRSFDERVSARIERIESQLDELRLRIDEAFGRVEEILRGMVAREMKREERTNEREERIGAIETGLGKLADAFDRQLEQTESALDAVKRTSERHLAEVREGHIRQFELFEEARREQRAAEEKAREILGSELLAIADRLERDARLPVPVARRRRADDDSDQLPWQERLRFAWRGFRERASRVATLETRLEEIEAFLRARAEESAELGRRIRAAWIGTAGSREGANESARDAGVDESESIGKLAAEIKARRGASYAS